ncbi:hypothetical protein WJX73_002002 [Symbiochloris irregularis]|uniref:Uncharacterized protein n=1 Tax=Symbiochloris irregularis TaxID=706552 RepID=A0AAW1NJI7_9CHLO
MSSGYTFENAKRDSSASKRRSPSTAVTSVQSLGSTGSAEFQEAVEDLHARSGSVADSDYQDAASEASGASSMGVSWADADEGSFARGSTAIPARSPTGSSPEAEQPQAGPSDQHAWKAKLEEALQAKAALEASLTAQQERNGKLQAQIEQLEAKARKSAHEARAAAAVSAGTTESQEAAVARLVGGVIGRIVASHQTEQAFTSKVATLQMRLERMGRMEASISAARRSNDDSASADRSRRVSLAIALGACGCGALTAWLLMSRLQQSK